MSTRVREQRMAAVDRTPKPCHHKQANHQHGTNAAYVLDKCRCDPCRIAKSEHHKAWARTKAYGRYDKYVPATQARAHILHLMAQGMGLKQIVKSSDASQGQLWKLIYGKRRPDGSRTPTKRVLRTTHDRILAITYQPADGALVDNTGTLLRLRALVAIGYPIAHLGRLTGIQNIHQTIHALSRLTGEPTNKVLASNADAVLAVYERLSMTPNTPTEWRAKSSANSARRYATKAGWLPPLALDDDAIDIPGWTHGLPDLDDEPLIDEVVVQRRLDGQKTRHLTPPETAEVVRRARLLGIPVNRVGLKSCRINEIA